MNNDLLEYGRRLQASAAHVQNDPPQGEQRRPCLMGAPWGPVPGPPATASLPSLLHSSFPLTASCMVALAFLHGLPQDQDRGELSSREGLQRLGLEQETGGSVGG